MYKHLLIIMCVLFLAGCNLVDQNTHDKYQKDPETKIVIDTSSITEAGKTSEVNLHVLEDGKEITDADITLYLRPAKEAEVWNKEYEVTQNGNHYTANLDIPEDGLYLISTHIETSHTNASPTKFFTVGELDMFEEVFLQEFKNEEHGSGAGHH